MRTTASSGEQFPFASAELATELARWQRHMSSERRLSPNTVEAYARDVAQFLEFLCRHLGVKLTLSTLSRLQPLDVRAFMAARRADGVSGRSLMRMLAGTRAFARFLQRSGKGSIGALAGVRGPKLAKTLPRPLTVASAKRMTETEARAGEDRAPWILARDAAVFALLYGSGLRISEALGLKRNDLSAPGDTDTIAVNG